MNSAINRAGKSLGPLLVAVLLTVCGLAAHGDTPAAPAPRVNAKIKLGNKTAAVILLAIQADKLQFCYQENPQVSTAIKVKDVQSATFQLDYDREVLAKATAKRDWDAAASLLYAAVWPALPFLVFPDNNGVPLALQAAGYMLRAGVVKSRCGTTIADRKLAEMSYKTAVYVYDKVAVAKWSEDADEARLKALLCRVLLERTDDARAQLADIGVPGRSDDTLGLYWLVNARLEFATGNYREALGFAVQSLGVETKDPYTFPDALLLSGLCYEQMANWYRARDVYYELAALFQGTPYAAVAAAHLRPIMVAGRTLEKEEVPIANVFFGSEDDVNAKAQQLLGLATAPAKPGAPGATDPKGSTPPKSGQTDTKTQDKSKEKTGK